MISLLNLKSLAGYIPSPLGRLAAHVPYSLRLGPVYARTSADIDYFQNLAPAEKREQVVERVKQIALHAEKHIPFYRDLYRKKGIRAEDITTLEELSSLPIVDKGLLRETPVSFRSARTRGCLPCNTGGTSGEPLAFYHDRHVFAREWAHMHRIWGRLGYRPTDLKLTFRGRNLGRRPVWYNALHNEYYVNSYCSPVRVADAVCRLARSVRYLHGYPSAIYEFVRFCSHHRPGLLDILRRSLRGIFYGSEYPAPIYRDFVHERLGVPSISWYGHSEFAILAYETEPYVYVPFYSYGYCEAVPSGSGDLRLVGTGYWNMASPFIRYDTGDLVTAEFEEGLLKCFRVSAGRIGEFVEDASGNRISLTSLIFGRHHPIFSMAQFIQVRQAQAGSMEVLVTPGQSGRPSDTDLSQGFDFSNVDIAVSVRLVETPFRTPAGKVPLLVPGDEIR